MGFPYPPGGTDPLIGEDVSPPPGFWCLSVSVVVLPTLLRDYWGPGCEKRERRQKPWDFHLFSEHESGLEGFPNAHFWGVSCSVFRPGDTGGKKGEFTDD